jgi:hypothetical protein
MWGIRHLETRGIIYCAKQERAQLLCRKKITLAELRFGRLGIREKYVRSGEYGVVRVNMGH